MSFYSITSPFPSLCPSSILPPPKFAWFFKIFFFPLFTDFYFLLSSFFFRLTCSILFQFFSHLPIGLRLLQLNLFSFLKPHIFAVSLSLLIMSFPLTKTRLTTGLNYSYPVNYFNCCFLSSRMIVPFLSSLFKFYIFHL